MHDALLANQGAKNVEIELLELLLQLFTLNPMKPSKAMACLYPKFHHVGRQQAGHCLKFLSTFAVVDFSTLLQGIALGSLGTIAALDF